MSLTKHNYIVQP